MIDTQTRILRQVLLKIASEQLCEAESIVSAKKLTDYAKELEKECKDWL